MGRIAAELADVAIVTSDNPRSEDPAGDHRRRSSPARPALEVELDRRVAIERALESARAGRRRRDRRARATSRGRRSGRQASVRRPRGRARGAAPAEGAGVIRARDVPCSPGSAAWMAGRRGHGRSGRLASDRRRATSSSPSAAAPSSSSDALARGAAARSFRTMPFAALAAIGGAVRDRSDARVVGITGSMGKTSTKDILRRSARRSGARSRRRRASTTSSACR